MTKEDPATHPAKIARFEMETCSQPCSHKLPAGLADYIKRYISEHVTDKEVKENILTEKNVPSNIKGKPIFGQLYKGTFIGNQDNINIKP